MMERVKSALKGLLRRYHYVVSYFPPGVVRGIDFHHDLGVVVNRDSPMCLDVGANRGQTIEMFQRVFKTPVIHAFEPASDMFEELRAKSFPGRVTLHNFALGNCNEKREFINLANPCLSSFLKLDHHDDNCFKDIGVKNKEVVEVRTVDWFLSQNRIDAVDLLKIDTQGFDMQVLLGTADSLRRGMVKNVLVELNFVRLYENQNKATAVMDFLADNRIHLVDFYEKVGQHKTLAWCTALFAKR